VFDSWKKLIEQAPRPSIQPIPIRSPRMSCFAPGRSIFVRVHNEVLSGCEDDVLSFRGSTMNPPRAEMKQRRCAMAQQNDLDELACFRVGGLLR
jgi:hypothetical protein